MGAAVVLGFGVVAVDVGVEVNVLVAVDDEVVVAVECWVLVAVDVGVLVTVVAGVLVAVLSFVRVAVLDAVVVWVVDTVDVADDMGEDVAVDVGVVDSRHPVPSASPSPSNPKLHVHSYDPSTLPHMAFASQASSPPDAAIWHSSTSMQ